MTTARTCGHDHRPSGARACEHLVGRSSSARVHQRLTGVGLEVDLLCEACVDAEGVEGVEVYALCADCQERVRSNGTIVSTRGEPGVSLSLRPFDATVREISLAGLSAPAVDLAPISAEPGAWVVLDARGGLSRVGPGGGPPERFGAIPIRSEPAHQPWNGHALRPRLHVSHTGRFVAVVNDYGRHGAVFDREARRESMVLDGGDYYPETVPFSFAFVEHAGRTVAVHRTDWNRLDASDPETGALLTARERARSTGDEPMPEHDLDYFHGRLHPSPSGRSIADDGWIWHPIGVPVTWRVDRWLGENRWETEDGPSKRGTPARDYYWDHGMCWIDERRLAVEGIGEDDSEMIDGVIVYDVEREGLHRGDWRDGVEVSRFPGPRGELFSDGARLFSSDARGSRIWDLASGALIGELVGFRPSRQHRAASELAELSGNTLRLWSY